MTDKEKNILQSKIEDKKMLGEKRLAFTKFLSPLELSFALNILNAKDRFLAFGGFENSERKLIIFYPTYTEKYDVTPPISILKVKFKANITHSDVLGSVLGLKIKRELIGDILVYDKFCYIFVLDEICDFLLLNFSRIGRQEIKVEKVELLSNIEIVDNFKVIKDTVSSMRFDNLVSVCFNISREKAQTQIKAQNVYLNDKICDKADKKVQVLDKINIRGKGKAIITDILGKSKKDRIFVEIKKYI